MCAVCSRIAAMLSNHRPGREGLGRLGHLCFLPGPHAGPLPAFATAGTRPARDCSNRHRSRNWHDDQQCVFHGVALRRSAIVVDAHMLARLDEVGRPVKSDHSTWETTELPCGNGDGVESVPNRVDATNRLRFVARRACLVDALGNRQQQSRGGPVPAYIVANYTITNPESLEAYGPHSVASIEKHGGEILVADFDSEPMEGEPGHATVVVQFQDKDAARAWYNSADYQSIIDRRLDNSFGIMTLSVHGPSGGFDKPLDMG